MLSVARMAGGQEQYYLKHAREEYHSQGAEKVGQWYGEGAAKLGLSGNVEGRDLWNLLKGLDPAGERALVQIFASREHRPGWDLTFSVPKSASVLWAAASPVVAAKIEAAQLRAVHAGVQYIQDVAAVTRRGHGGARHERAQLTVALFEHRTSRAQQPQLHTHALLVNVAGRSDGTFGTLETQPIFEHQLAAGAVYRAELAASLRRELGLRVEKDGTSFRLLDVPRELERHWSTRSDEIKAETARLGLTTAKAKEIAALSTRRAKEHVPFHELKREWQATAVGFGFGEQNVAALVHKTVAFKNQDPELTAKELAAKSVDSLIETHGKFLEQEAVRDTAQHAVKDGIESKLIRRAVNYMLTKSGRVQAIIAETGHKLFTSVEQRDLESRLVEVAKRLASDNRHKMGERFAAKGLAKLNTLTEEQREAVFRAITGEGAIHCVQGVAGTGKSTVLKAAKRLFERAGFEVIPVSAMGTAAHRVADGGSEARTLQSLFYRAAPTTKQRLAHHATQIVRAALGKSTYAFEHLHVTNKSVLLVDSAQTLTNRSMLKLLETAERGGAKVVLAGDTIETPAVERRGAFKLLTEHTAATSLRTIERQCEDWERDAVRQLAIGDTRGAFIQYALAQRLHVASDPRSAKAGLIHHWRKHNESAIDKSLIIANTAKEARELNQLAQKARQEAGDVGRFLKQRANGTWLYQGDRVLLTASSRVIGFRTGDTGTIERVGLDTLTIRLDRTHSILGFERSVRVKLTPKYYKALQLGYAVTAFRSQEMNPDSAYAMLSGQDSRTAYLQLSRARLGTHVFATYATGGEGLQEAAQLVWKNIANDLVRSNRHKHLFTATQGVSP